MKHELAYFLIPRKKNEGTCTGKEQQKEIEISQEMKQETFLIFDCFTVPLYVWNSEFLAKLFPELNRIKFQVRSSTTKFIKKKTIVTLLAAWLLVLDANGNSLAVYQSLH